MVAIAGWSGDLPATEPALEHVTRQTKQDIPLWICQLSTRVDAATFRELKIKASQLGGWWSSFVKRQAGFQFKTPEAAEQFRSLLAGSVNRSDILADRKARKISLLRRSFVGRLAIAILKQFDRRSDRYPGLFISR